MTPLNVPVPSIEQLTQNCARLLQEQLAQAVQVADPAKLTTMDLDLARSNIRALAFVQGAGLHGAYRYLRDFIARQAVPSLSTAEFLDGWLATYGMTRKPAAAATGTVVGSGVDGSVLFSGTVLQVDDGRQYRVTAAATVAGGVVTAQVQARVAGAAGNLAAGADLVLSSPITGIDAAFVAGSPSGLSGGADVESDTDAVYRLQQRLAAEPMGGCPADYARWALQVPGITRAWGVRNPAGPTSAGVLIMADGNAAPGLPTEDQREDVEDYIRDPMRGPPDELFVIIPTAVPVNFTITLYPDSTAARNAATQALKDLFIRESMPGGEIPHSHAIEALSAVAGEYNHAISAPAITSGGVFSAGAYNQLLVLGTVTYLAPP